MKQWAQAFYLSQNWKDTSRAYLLTQNNICERCGEPAKICHHKTYLTRENINDQAIALSWDNLEALCQDCHNKEHHRTEKEQALQVRRGRKYNLPVVPPFPRKIKGVKYRGGNCKKTLRARACVV